MNLVAIRSATSRSVAMLRIPIMHSMDIRVTGASSGDFFARETKLRSIWMDNCYRDLVVHHRARRFDHFEKFGPFGYKMSDTTVPLAIHMSLQSALPNQRG